MWATRTHWIFKPSASTRGIGIRVLSSKEPPPHNKRGVVQCYLTRPLLVTGRKFDHRLYVLVTSLSPLRVYMHENGLVRFATHQYTPDSVDDLCAHLTNFSINKADTSFVISETSTTESIDNSKWSLDFFKDYLKSQHIDPTRVMCEIERAVVATTIAGMSEVREFHTQRVIYQRTCYEMYGFDVLLDESLNPYVIEMNVSPSLCAKVSSLDARIKSPVMHDLLRLVRVVRCNARRACPCPALDLLEREFRASASAERVSSVECGKVRGWSAPVFSDIAMVLDFLEEKERSGGFRRIYPRRKTMRDFDACFPAMKYHDIVFGEWIMLDNEKRIEIIENNFEIFKSTLDRIKSELDEIKNQK